EGLAQRVAGSGHFEALDNLGEILQQHAKTVHLFATGITPQINEFPKKFDDFRAVAARRRPRYATPTDRKRSCCWTAGSMGRAGAGLASPSHCGERASCDGPHSHPVAAALTTTAATAATRRRWRFSRAMPTMVAKASTGVMRVV